jgi:hypothetical protein
MSHGVVQTSGSYFADEQMPGRHSAARHYGDSDGEAPHVCEFCSPEPEVVAPAPSRSTGGGGRHSAGVRRWGSQEAVWNPEL